MEMAARRKRKTASSFKMQWLCEAKAEECRVGMRSNDDDDDNEVSVVSGCHLRCDLMRGEMFPMGVHVMNESDLEEVRSDGPALVQAERAPARAALGAAAEAGAEAAEEAAPRGAAVADHG